MLFTNSTFIGIDPTAGHRPFVYVALDHDLSLLAVGQGTIDEILAFTAGQRQAIVGVCAPRRPNQGLMSRSEVRQNLIPSPAPGRWENLRVADYILRQHNITIPNTPGNMDECPGWMQMGFRVYQRIEGFSYRCYPNSESECQYLEVYPHASYTVMLGVIPFPKHTLEGRLQRQLLLYEHKLKIPDPMRIFEEITRFRILNGRLPLEELFEPGELDALIAAYTAWVAAVHPEQISLIGDSTEGQIVLPASEIKTRYSSKI